MKTIVVSLFFIIMSLSLMSQTPVTLKLNLEKSKVYTIKTTSQQKIQQTASGQQVSVDVVSNRVITYKVLDKKDDIMEVEFSFDTIASKINSPMYSRETNSAKPGTEPLEKILNKLSSTKLIVNLSTAGKFIGFVNYSKFRESVLMVLDSVPASKKEAAMKQAETLLKETALKSMIEPFFAYLPDKAINVGNKWETSYMSSSNDIASVVLNSYILKGVENNSASFTGTSEMESLPSNNPNAQMTQELKGTSIFDGSLDITTGLCLKRTENGFFEGKTTVKSNAEEMVIPMQINVKSVTIMSK